MKTKSLLAAVGLAASVLIWSGTACADFASRCSGCHGALNNQPQNSGPIRTANNRAYLDYKITNEMGGFSGDGNGGYTSLPAAQRDAIVAEIATVGYGPTFTSGAPPGGTAGVSYSHQVSTDAKPSSTGTVAIGNHLYAIVAGGLPPGLGFDVDSGLISGVPTVGGTYTGTVRANNLVGSSDQAFSIVIATPPPNDNFANAATLTGGNTTVIVNNASATKEAGEQGHAGNAGGHSVWWSWTAPSTNPVSLNTCYQQTVGQNIVNSTFDTLLAVYTGNNVGTLSTVAYNDEDDSLTCLFSSSSALSFNAVQGTAYRIAVDGFGGATGNIRLSLYQEQILKVIALNSIGASGRVVSNVGGVDCLDASCTASLVPGTVITLTATPQPGSAFGGWNGGGCSGYAFTCTVTVNAATTVIANFRTMPNDNFANRIVLASGVTSGSGYNSTATKETGEPNHGGNPGGHSLWWTWIAPTSGAANITLAGSDFDTLLGVYTGAAVGGLTLVAGNDDFGGGLQSEATFYATAGTAYHFAVDGYNTNGVSFAVGTVNFLIRQPGNDNFLTRLALTGGTVTVVDNNGTATKETGEFNHAGNAGGRSLWWTWTAPSTDTVTVNTCGSSFDTLLAVYTGGFVTGLTSVAFNDDSLNCGTSNNSWLQFAATAGTVYQLAVDGYGGASGSIQLGIIQRQAQTIAFAAPASQAFSTSPISLTATASSGLAVSFSTLTPSVCSVAGSNLTMLAVGTCTVAANQGGNASYYPAPQVQGSFAIGQAAQSISFGAQMARSYSAGGTFTISPLAIASSGLAIAYASNTIAICTVSGVTVSIMATGACSITASQAGNANYTMATPVTVTFAINPGSQTITFNMQMAQSFAPGGSFAINPLATASSMLAVMYTSLTSAVCTVSGATVNIVATGTCTVAANQAGNANYNPAVQVPQGITINSIAPAPPTIGTATPGNTQATISFTPPANTGGSPLASFRATCNPGAVFANGTVSPITVTGLTNGAAYTCAVTATNAAMLTSAASSSVSVTPTGTPVPPSITSASSIIFTALTAGNFAATATGTPTPTLTLMGTLPTGVAFTSALGSAPLTGTPASGTVGTYPLTITASSTSGTVMQSFTLTVQKRGQTITFANPGAQGFSATPLTISATSTAALAVTLTSSTPSTCTVSGNSVTLLTVGSCTIVASQPGDANTNAAATVTQSFSVGASAQLITFAAQAVTTRGYTPSGMFAINPLATASSGLAVTYSSATTSICSVSGTTATMLAAGICTIAANQAGDANYAAASQVTRGVSITATAPGAPAIGTATAGNTQATINFTAPVNTGGSAITQYTATCGALTGSAIASPITVPGLTNGTSYTCTVTATNAGALTSLPSTGVMVTPISTTGSTIWTSICSSCHGPTPTGTHVNPGGTTPTVLNYVILNQATMNSLPSITNLTQSDRAAVATYILNALPAINVSTPNNTPLPISVAGTLFLGSISFTDIEVVTTPVSGTLSAFSGTSVTYTPNPGFSGTDSFTYRGKRTAPAMLTGDPRGANITVFPASPTITSATTASGTYGQAFSYQIAATTLPTLYGASGLPTGVTVNTANGLISGTPLVTGISNAMITASNDGGMGSAALAITINKANQIISFPAQVALTRSFSPGGTFPINPTASGGSVNAVTYSSATPGVCSVSSTTVTITTAGICTVAANQLGDGNYNAAAPATQSVTITPIAPGAPVIGTATPGNGSAIFTFTPPGATGGSPVTSYTVTCNNGAVPASGGASPITVTSLVIGTQYTCTVTATSAGGTSAPSGSVMVTPVAIAFTGNVYSRKTHGAAGDKDLTVNGMAAINGAITVEPRALGSGHRIIFRFNNPVSSVTSLSVLDAGMVNVGTASSSFSGSDLIVTLTGIPDNKRVTVTATGVNGALTVSTSIGFLVGDVSNSQSVSAADISAVKARVGQSVGMGNNFLFDLDANGTITNSDISAVKVRSGLVLPP